MYHIPLLEGSLKLNMEIVFKFFTIINKYDTNYVIFATQPSQDTHDNSLNMQLLGQGNIFKVFKKWML